MSLLPRDERRGLILVLAAMVLTYGPMLGRPSLWDVDEAIYADISRTMAETGDWVLPVFNGEPRFDKPPLLLWIGAVGIRILGESELAVRLGSFAFGLLTVILVHSFARRHYSRRAAALAALVLASTLGWFIAARMGLLDTALTFFTGWTLYHVDSWQRGHRWAPAWIGTALALGVLSKGPVVLILAGGTALLAFGPRRLWSCLASQQTVAGVVAFAGLALPWHVAIYQRAKEAWIADYFGYHMLTRFTQPIEAHGFPWYFYLLVLAVGLLPWSGFAALAVWQRLRRFLRGQRGLSAPSRLFFWWFATVFVFFSASRTKLPGYILPAFPAVAILLGAWCDRVLSRASQESRLFERGLWLSGGVGLLSTAALWFLRPLVPADYADALPVLFLVPLTLILGMVLTQAVHRLSGDPATLLYGFAGTALSALLVLGTGVIPLGERVKPVKPLAAAAAQHLTPSSWVVSAMGDASTTFYLGQPVTYVHDAADLERVLGEGAREGRDLLALVPASLLEAAGLEDRVEVIAAHGFGRLVRPARTVTVPPGPRDP